MCTVCGCSEGEVRVEGASAGEKDARAPEKHTHSHDHAHGYSSAPVTVEGDNLHFGRGPAHAHAPGLSQTRMVQIEQDILAKITAMRRLTGSVLCATTCLP